jgi:GT2 family glycosyltransferase
VQNHLVTLSVVIPTLDGVAVLGKTLEGLASQRLDGMEAEVLVVDNGSSDGTLDLACEWERRSPLVRVLQEPVRGASAARNRGVLESRYPFILFLNDDTAPTTNDLLLRHARLLEERPSGTAFLGRVAYPPEYLQDPFLVWLDHKGQFDYSSLDAGAEPTDRHFYTAHVSFARADFDAAGGMDPRLEYGFDDAVLGSRLREEGVRLQYRPELLVLHHHPVDHRTWRSRMIVLGRAGWLCNALRPDRSRLAPHTLGPYWIAQQIAADLIATAPHLLDRLPGKFRDYAYQLYHQGSYARGYRAAMRTSPGR